MENIIYGNSFGIKCTCIYIKWIYFWNDGVICILNDWRIADVEKEKEEREMIYCWINAKLKIAFEKIIAISFYFHAKSLSLSTQTKTRFMPGELLGKYEYFQELHR